MSHYVLITPAQRERRAADALRALGIEALVPVEYRYRRHHQKHRDVKIAYPAVIFPRYVVAGFASAPRWYDLVRLEDVRGRRLITGALGADGKPRKLFPHEVEPFRILGDHQKPEAIPAGRQFKPGDKVIIDSGPFAGFVVKVKRIRKGKLAFDWSFLGKLHEIEIAAELVEAA